MAESQAAITWWAIVSAFGGTIIGSTVGGLVSYCLQRKALKATKAQREEDRFEKRKALGFSLYVKMIRVASDLHNMGKAIAECMAEAKKAGFKGSPFQVIRPMVPSPDAVQFSADELALVLSIDAPLFNEIGVLDQLHGSTVALFALYATKREALLEKFGAEMDGYIGTTTLTPEQKLWFDPRAVELNMLVEAMIQRTQLDAQEAWAGLEKLHALLEKEFKTKLKLERKEPTPSLRA